MKEILKANEIEAVEKFITNHPYARLIKNYKEWLDFKAGDVLIRYRFENNMVGKIDFVSERCRVPKKFKVIYIDEIGCPWVKNVNVRGGLGNKLYNLIESPAYVYKTDPELMDCLIMDAKYDPRAQYRDWRRENPNYGGQDAGESE